LAQKWQQNENIGLLKLDWKINNSQFTNLIWKMVQKVKKNDPKQTYISLTPSRKYSQATIMTSCYGYCYCIHCHSPFNKCWQ
jgi:hypothetical protein